MSTREVASVRALTEAQRGFTDWLGVALLGTATDAAVKVTDMAYEQYAPGAAVVLPGRRRLSAVGAALVNGTASHAHDYDDVGLGVGHPSVVVAPAALAVAESLDASGRELLEAMVIGYEVAARFASLPPHSLAGAYERGYHGTSIYGIFGATAAAARLLRLDSRQVANALGIAASECAGLRVNFGTMTKPYHAGVASSAGVRSALMAKSGFTSCPSAIEDQFGWFDVIGRSGSLVSLIDDPDRPFAVERGLWFKAYPCCGANHFAIDGLLSLLEQHEVSDAMVNRVEATVHRSFLEDVLVYDWPTSGLQGKFCLPFNLAAALVDRTVSVATFDDSHLERLSSHRHRVAVHGSSRVEMRDAVVKVHMHDGRVLESTTTDGRTRRPGVRVLRGMEANPLTWDQLAAKFRDNASAHLDDAPIGGILTQLTSLAGLTTVRDLTESIVAGSTVTDEEQQ